MNTPERNNKNIDKMRALGKVYSETDEDRTRNTLEDDALENATREYPLPTTRKFAWVMCGGFWLFCLGGLLFGVDMRALMPFMFFSLAFVALVHLPVFYLKKKIFDVIVGTVFAMSCIGMGLSMLVR